MNDLAALYWSQGQYAEAGPLYTKALEGMRRVLGEDHPDTLGTMNNLAALYWTQGKVAPAESLFVRALEGMRRVFGEAHPETLRGMSNVATVYQHQGKQAQAELLYKNILDIQRRVLGETHPDTLTSMSNLALTYMSQRKFAEAEALLRETVRTFERATPDSWQRYNGQGLLGASVAGQEKYAEAEPLLVSGYEGLVQRQATIPVESRSALKEAGLALAALLAVSAARSVSAQTVLLNTYTATQQISGTSADGTVHVTVYTAVGNNNVEHNLFLVFDPSESTFSGNIFLHFKDAQGADFGSGGFSKPFAVGSYIAINLTNLAANHPELMLDGPLSVEISQGGAPVITLSITPSTGTGGTGGSGGGGGGSGQTHAGPALPPWATTLLTLTLAALIVRRASPIRQPARSRRS